MTGSILRHVDKNGVTYTAACMECVPGGWFGPQHSRKWMALNDLNDHLHEHKVRADLVTKGDEEKS